MFFFLLSKLIFPVEYLCHFLSLETLWTENMQFNRTFSPFPEFSIETQTSSFRLVSVLHITNKRCHRGNPQVESANTFPIRFIRNIQTLLDKLLEIICFYKTWGFMIHYFRKLHFHSRTEFHSKNCNCFEYLYFVFFSIS